MTGAVAGIGRRPTRILQESRNADTIAIVRSLALACAAHLWRGSGPGILARSARVPESVLIDPDHIGHVPAKVIGIVTELKKRLGDLVEKGEIVAYLESREVADAKSEYLTANVNLELQSTLFDRERSLWEKKISAEQQFLRAENAFTGAKLRRDKADWRRIRPELTWGAEA